MKKILEINQWEAVHTALSIKVFYQKGTTLKEKVS